MSIRKAGSIDAPEEATAMKRLNMLSTTALAFGLTAGACLAVGAPYAPVLSHPKPKPGSPEAAMAALTVPFAVPEAKDVGIPAYPGARIERIEGRSMEGWQTYSGLPDLIMLSTDSVEQVHDFYAAQLKGWSVVPMHPGYWFKGAEESLGDDTVQPRVEIDAVADMMRSAQYRKDMPGARTIITVRYLPPQLRHAKAPEKVDFPPKAKPE